MRSAAKVATVVLIPNLIQNLCVFEQMCLVTFVSALWWFKKPFCSFNSSPPPPSSGPHIRPVLPSAASCPGGRVWRVPAHRSLPDCQRGHSGGWKHSWPDRPAGPEERSGPRLSEGAGGGRAGAAVSPLPAGGGVLRPRPLPPHPQPGRPQTTAQSLPQVPPELPPVLQQRPGGASGGGRGSGGEGGGGGGRRGVGQHGASGGEAKEKNHRGRRAAEEKRQEEEKELRDVCGVVRVWDI